MLRRLLKPLRLRRASEALACAQSAYEAAREARDTRRQHEALKRLREARHGVLRAGQCR